MPTTDHEAPTTGLAPGAQPHPSDSAGPLVPAVDRSGVEHWQRRLDLARATLHLRRSSHDER